MKKEGVGGESTKNPACISGIIPDGRLKVSHQGSGHAKGTKRKGGKRATDSLGADAIPFVSSQVQVRIGSCKKQKGKKSNASTRHETFASQAATRYLDELLPFWRKSGKKEALGAKGSITSGREKHDGDNVGI